MKQLTLILFVILMSCKNQTNTETVAKENTEVNTENHIDKSVYDMWNSFSEANPQFKDDELPESDFFHNNKKDANRLAILTANGKKRASSGLLSLYQHYNIDLPKVRTKQIITDFDGKAYAIIENKSVDTIPFNKISEEYAELDMGTNVEALKKWKKVHWDFFENFLKENKVGQLTEDMLIVCVKFETIWPKKN